MKRHPYTLPLVVVFSLLLATASHAAPREVKIAKSGETSLRTVLGGKTIEITFHTAIVKKSDPGFPLALDHYDDLSIVQGMSIVVDAKTIGVPWSAYADLFFTRKGYLEIEKGTFVLTIVGADGADTYFAHIYFDAKRVIKRDFYSSLVPHRPLEETVYSPVQVLE